MDLTAIMGNCGLLHLIQAEETLHKSVCSFPCALSSTDSDEHLGLPKALCSFWLRLKEIDFDACLVQMLFVHTVTGTESGVLMLMALDRPLVTAVGLGNFLRGVVLGFLSPSVPGGCCTNIIPHTHCDHMSVVKLVYVSILVNAVLGLLVVLLIGDFKILCIAISSALIFQPMEGLSSKEASTKAFGTCTTHISAIAISNILLSWEWREAQLHLPCPHHQGQPLPGPYPPC
nr:PREDICTED: olfactory receptor 52N4-like [Struthio camelus australis]